MRLLALLAALPACLMAADDKKDEKKVKDEEAILGTWKFEKVESFIKDGKDGAADILSKQSITFSEGGKGTEEAAGGEKKAVGYKLDPSVQP